MGHYTPYYRSRGLYYASSRISGVSTGVFPRDECRDFVRDSGFSRVVPSKLVRIFFIPLHVPTTVVSDTRMYKCIGRIPLCRRRLLLMMIPKKTGPNGSWGCKCFMSRLTYHRVLRGTTMHY